MQRIGTRDGLVWLDDPGCLDVRLVGGKAAHLSRLLREHCVPPGFCLSIALFRRYGASGRLPDQLMRRLGEAYRELARRCGVDEPSVAVRSSAVEEDGEAASFAGQHETFLNLRGVEAIGAAVERCWDSARTERALAYRRHWGAVIGDAGLAVLVQQLVPADVSAVVFSADPVGGRRDRAVVTASWGLGESIVGGTVTPDTWHVDRATLTTVSFQLGDKARMTVLGRDEGGLRAEGQGIRDAVAHPQHPAPGPRPSLVPRPSSLPTGTREVDVPRVLRRQPSLSEAQVREAVALAARLEGVVGGPVDVECAFAGGRLYLLQCRPITAFGRQPVADLPRAAD